MQSALASLVRTSAQQAGEQASAESEAACTAKLCEQLTLFDLNGCSSKTAPSSAPEAGTSSLPTLWRVDTPGATDSLPRLMLAPLTSAIGGGALPDVPTPTVYGNYNRKGASPTSGDGLATWAKLWPTPTASLADKGGRITQRKSREGGTLIEAVSARTTWPTPVASDWRSGMTSEATASKNSRPLREQVMWRTPSATVIDPKSTVVKLTGRKPTDPQVGLADQVGGALNPEWVEWLMGWPIGHTESKHWAMAKSRSKLPMPGSLLAARTTSEVSG